jgi:hypothetical protein
MRISGGKRLRLLALVGFCGLIVLGATGLCRILRPTEDTPTDPQTPPSRLFRGWQKPDVALVVSAEQHGYLLPCGCSRPQYGGLERRYNFLQTLKDRGWPIAPVDLGDLPQRKGPRDLPNVQGLIKYRYSMESLQKMNYLAVGLGEFESALSLFDVLGEYALNNPTPAVVAANLHDKDKLYPDQVKSHVVKAPQGSRLKVGVTGAIGPSVAAEVKKHKVELDDNRVMIPRVLNDLAKEGADVKVLLYQGSVEEAKKLAAAHREFHVVLCLSPEDEPSSEPVRVEDALIISVGHKGRYVGVVGVYATGKPERPFDLRYQMVTLNEDYLTAEGDRAKQPILGLMEQYQRELKSGNYLAKYGQVKHPAQHEIPGVVPTFVGSDKCKKCHELAYDVWEKSKHAHAFRSLEQVKSPSLRVHDAECIVCHTVGFGYESGYRNEKDTPHLKDVGCESCHGPGSEHVKKSKDERWYPILNPWRPAQNETAEAKRKRQDRIDLFCQGCHDIDNDVKYKFETRWPDVAHPTGGQ